MNWEPDNDLGEKRIPGAGVTLWLEQKFLFRGNTAECDYRIMVSRGGAETVVSTARSRADAGAVYWAAYATLAAIDTLGAS